MHLPTSYLYLGGPIMGLSYDETIGWREHVSKKLPPHIVPVSPMRAKEFLSGESVIRDAGHPHPLASDAGITSRDRFDVMRSDALLVNFTGATKVSIGSVGEIFWADILRKPVIIAMEKGNVHDHPMVREIAGFSVESLDEAIEIAVAVLCHNACNLAISRTRY